MSKKSVEFQILESDVLRQVEERFGENEVDLIRSLFNLGEENFELGVVMLLFKGVLNADQEDLHRLIEVLTITKNVDENLYRLYLAFFGDLLYKKINDSHEN